MFIIVKIVFRHNEMLVEKTIYPFYTTVIILDGVIWSCVK